MKKTQFSTGWLPTFEPKTFDASPSRAGSSIDAESLHLTEREREIIQLLIERKARKQIADVLEIEISTVAFHLRNVRRKLAVHSIVEVVLFFACQPPRRDS